MIERIIEFSVRNPLIVIVLTCVMAVWGVQALYQTPVDAIPDLSENQITVFADWPGRSPQEVEDQVAYPLSVNLQGLAGIKSVRSVSDFGFAMVNLVFDDKIDFYFARQRVMEKLGLATTFLPTDAKAYLASDSTAVGQIFWYTIDGEGVDIGRRRAIQDWFVRYQLGSVAGVAEVASVGGMPIEYQIDIDPDKLRAFGVTLGDLYEAIQKSNSSVGGRIIQKANSEYLVRSIGWIESLDDIRDIVIRSSGGTPVQVADVAIVQTGSAQRRSVLEKNGQEAVGGVVMMRFGENPLAVTERIKAKIRELQPGLPAGVYITPFYDRTTLINDAIGTVQHALVEEIIVASLAVILIMGHVRSALVICLMLPLSVLASFLLMRLTGISSNIMSLAGIAISIGVLVDAAIVMVDQAAHTLHKKFGYNRVTGDTRELLIPALKMVGRPIFFSLLIMIISFLPVFALSGREGKMFHPLAYTKTFALVGVCILAITLVPSILPILARGRLRAESDNWIVRRVIEVYRPVLYYLMDHPWPVVLVTAILFVMGASVVGSVLVFRFSLAIAMLMVFWAAREEDQLLPHHWIRWVVVFWGALLLIGTIFYFRGVPFRSIVPFNLSALIRPELVAVSFGLVAIPMIWLLSRLRFSAQTTLLSVLLIVGLISANHIKPLGRQFMPPLDEGSIVDMPVTVPRASVTQVADDLKVRDSLIRQFPEVASVVGKAGRAETPTDPAPLDMVETVINLHPKNWWPNRHLDYTQVEQGSERIAEVLANRDEIDDEATTEENVGTWLAAANMDIATEFDRIMREKIRREISIIEDLTRDLIAREIVAQTVRTLRPTEHGSSEAIALAAQIPAVQLLRSELGARLDGLEASTIDIAISLVRDWLAAQQLPDDSANAELIAPLNWQRPIESLGRAAGLDNVDWSEYLIGELTATRDQFWGEEIRRLNWRINDSAGFVLADTAVRQILAAVPGKWRNNTPSEEQIGTLAKSVSDELAMQFDLRRKTKNEILQELDSFVRTPGWSNIWTQPIINRIDMLATGVRTPIGVKIFGKDIHQIQDVAQQVAAVLKGGNGRAGVVGAIDVTPDQIVGEGYLEIAINRQRAARYGVAVGDVQDVIESALGGRSITLTVEGRERFPVRIRYARDFRDDEESVKRLLINASVDMPSTSQIGKLDSADFNAERLGSPPTTMQIPLSQVADVRITEGPSMIKSENGMLRFYVQLNTNDDDVLGFVERAKAAVAAEVKLPPGTYIEWSGQFEHQLRSRKTLLVVTPFVLIAIFLLIYLTYHDLADTLSVLFLAVPGAVFGGLLMQWLLGFPFSVAVWVGYIACFGLAAESGLVILVYLREAVERRALAGPMTDDELKMAVLEGAVQRTRPKLMTELTTIVGLAPMLWATGTGSEIIQPMAAPVLGGLLVADEVIDLLLPSIFYRVRRWRMRQQLIEGAKPD